MNQNDLISILKEIFPSRAWPRPLHVFQALSLIESGSSIEQAAKAVGTAPFIVKAAKKSRNPISVVLGLDPKAITDTSRSRASQILGQLLLGRAAEIAFEDIYKSEVHSDEFELRDLREG